MSETLPGAGIFIQMSDGMRGPFGLELIMQLVDGRAINRETIVANSEAGPWIPLGRHDIAGELFQPKRVFVLKPAEIHRVNTTDWPPVDHHEIICMANQGYSGCQKSASGPAKPLNDAQALLQENALVNASHEPPMIIVQRKYRRFRDYLFLIVAGDGIGVMLAIDLRFNPVFLVLAISFVTIYTAAVTWHMWVVMDRH